MRSLQKTTLSLSITFALALGQSAYAAITYSGDTVFVGPPPPAQGAGSWRGYGGSVNVGETYSGTLNVTDGASISASGLGIGSYGTTTISGASPFIGGSSIVDVSSIANYGNLIVSDGAKLNHKGGFAIFFLASGSSTLLESGARLTAPGPDSLTIDENASLIIRDRAIAELNQSAIVNGGTVQVSDNGAQLNVQNNLQLSSGSAQNGLLQVTDGGRAEIGGALTLSGSGSGGNQAGLNILTTNGAPGATVSAGSVLLNDFTSRLSVTGAGSLLTVAGELISSGVADLRTGGKIVADSLTNRGGGIVQANGRGTALTVTNGLTNDNNLIAGNGAIVRAGSLTNGGTVLFRDEDTRLEVAGQLTSTNTLAVQDGATLAADSILLQAGSTGTDSTLTLSGSGGTVESDTVTLASGVTSRAVVSSRAVVNFAHSSSDLRFAPRITGDGDVNVFSGITTLLAQNDYRGDTRLSGGVLRAGADNVFSAGSAYTLTPGGTLDLNGFSQRTGDIVNGGTLNLAGKTAGRC